MDEPFSIQEEPPPKDRGDDQCLGLCEEDSEDVEFGCVLKPALLGFLVVLCGTASTITGKLQYGVHAYGRSSCGTHLDDDAVDDDDHTQTHRCLFEKPWFQTFVMCAFPFPRARARASGGASRARASQSEAKRATIAAAIALSRSRARASALARARPRARAFALARC